MTRDDGGPAFPGKSQQSMTATGAEPRFYDVEHPGMSLRDWFAGMAMQGLITVSLKELLAYAGDAGAPICLAKSAYEIADQLLAERAKKDAGK